MYQNGLSTFDRVFLCFYCAFRLAQVDFKIMMSVLQNSLHLEL